MAKWTFDQVDAHREDVISPHFRQYKLYSLCLMIIEEQDDGIVAVVYPSASTFNSARELTSHQLDIFMASVNFDYDLFKMLTIILGIRADAALIASLS